MIWSKSHPRRKLQPNDVDGEEPTTYLSINASPPTIPQANRLYFYNPIDSDSILELNKQIDEASKQMQIVKITLELSEPPPIKLHINSRGGEITPALAAADKIRRCVVPIHTYCEGEIASAATLISIAGKKRFMTQNSFFLIHQLSSEFWGKYTEFEDEIQNLKMMMDVIKKMYTSYTSIPEAELDDLLKHDLYLTPEACLQWKMIDKII